MSGSPLVGIVMGSDSDWPTMQAAAEVCREFGVAYEARVVSAHRTPADMAEYGQTAHTRRPGSRWRTASIVARMAVGWCP